MASLLPASTLLLLLLLISVPLNLTDTVPEIDPETEEISEADLPTASDGNDTEIDDSSQPCKNGGPCGIHVFRVALSSRPEEVGDVVPVKQRKKYGSNVFVPRGSQDSFVLRDLAENIPAYIDSRVKDRIHEQDFVIKPEDTPGNGVVWVKEGEPLPKNFEPMRYVPPTTDVSAKKGLSVAETILLIICGVFFGIVLTAACFFCVAYHRQPRIDRSTARSYTRNLRISQETLPLHSVSSAGHYPPLQLPSSIRSTASSRSTFDDSLELAVFDDSSFRTRSSTARNYDQSPGHTSPEFFVPISRKISL